jgi:hypothetical protein
MTTRISSKLAALTIALTMNVLLMGGIAYVFDAQVHQNFSIVSFAKQLSVFQWLV